MKAIYTGSIPVKVRFQDGSDKKVKPGDVMELSEPDWSSISATGYFEKVETGEIAPGDEVEVIDGKNKGLKGKVKKLGGK